MMNQSDIPFCVVYVIDIQVDMLSYQDSNLDTEQNLQCCRYTIRQYLFETAKYKKCDNQKLFQVRNRLF